MNEHSVIGGIPELVIVKDDPSPGSAIDPICGMSVDPKTAISCEQSGTTWYFCCEHCRTKFLHSPTEQIAPPENVTSYFCPMCPGVVSDHPASCPICGMALEPDLATVAANETDQSQRDLWRRFVVATLFAIPLFLLNMLPMLGLNSPGQFSHGSTAVLEFLLALPVVGWCGWPFWVIGFRSLASRHWNMFTLIFIGVMAAFGYSTWKVLADSSHTHDLYFESAAVITTLVLLGQVLEQRARRRTGRAIRELMELTPTTAHRVQDGVETDIPLSQVLCKDILRVRPGERVPVDGQILDSTNLESVAERQNRAIVTTIDESLLTGEPMPVSKGPGDDVIAGSVNQTGTFLMRAERIGRSTMLSQIVDLVATAQRSRAPVQQLADQVAAWFTPAIVVIAGVTFFTWLLVGTVPRLPAAMTHAISVLIIACPCALGLATPMAVMVGMGRGAREGILFRTAQSLEALGRIDMLFIDKTGTLTEGRPSVVQVATSSGFDQADVLRLAASVEQYSEHPLARSICDAAMQAGLTIKTAADFQSETGVGVCGRVDGRLIEVGLRSDPQATLAGSGARNPGMTSARVSVEGQVVGEIAFSDQLRETAVASIRALNSQGVRVSLVTGDRRDVAQAVAAEVGIPPEATFAELKPGDKLIVINRARTASHVVAMAGDGINDAPALAVADVGISLGTGSDIAKQSADVILVQPNLMQLAKAIQLSRHVAANIRQNLFFAFVYNALGIPVAAGVLDPLLGISLSPMLAAAAMSLSSLTVISNSLRLQVLRLDADSSHETRDGA